MLSFSLPLSLFLSIHLSNGTLQIFEVTNGEKILDATERSSFCYSSLIAASDLSSCLQYFSQAVSGVTNILKKVVDR